MKVFIEKLISILDISKKEELDREDYVNENGHYSDVEEDYEDGKSEGRYQAYVKIINVISQLEKEIDTSIDAESKKQGWILCNERMPEEPDIQYQALEYFPEYNVTIDGAEKSTTLHYLGDGEWSDAEGNSYNVIAWQQLPEVYCPGEEKDSVKNARTRIECIRSMSVEEIADKIMENENLYAALNFCRNYAKCWEEVDEDECRKCLIKWLNSTEPKKSIPTEHFQERFNRVI